MMYVPGKGELLGELGRGLCLGLGRQAASTVGLPSIYLSPADSLEFAEPTVRGSGVQPTGRTASPVGRCHSEPGP